MEQRRRQAAESLRSHSLFGFQVHDAFVAERLRELQELLLATCGERDQVALLSENVRELEETLEGRSERFLLQPLRRFEQEMELLLDVASGEEVEEQDDEPSDEEQECLSLSQDPLFSDSPVLSADTTRAKETEDEVLCGVCCAPDSLENDPIVICEVCGVAVHQTCYRLAVVPDGDWYCQPCRQYLDAQDIEKNVIPTHELECQACCTKAGAFAPTADGGWVHVACSMFLPELYLQEKHTSRFQGPLDDLQVVCGLDKLKARRRLRCCFCKKSNEKGACAQCAVGKCVVAYHALCALRNGIKLRYMQDKGQFGSGCLKHQAEFLKLGGDCEDDVAVVEKKETSRAEKEDKPKPRSRRKNSWSDEDGSESDDESDDGDDLDSDSDQDGSQDSLSDEDLKDEKADLQPKPSPTKMSPPRLLGGPPIRKSGGKQGTKPRRNRQIKLYFASAEEKTATASSSHSQRPPREAVASAANAAHAAATPAAETAPIGPEVTANGRLVLDTHVFSPACYPAGYKAEDISEQAFEYVMVLITTRPLGLGIASSTYGPGMFLLAKTTSNPALIAAIKQGVIQNSDEVFALNDRVLRTMDMKSFKELVPCLPLPIRCWIRTKRKSKAFSSTTSEAASGVETPVRPVSVTVSSPPVSATKHTPLPLTSPTTYQAPSETTSSQPARGNEPSRASDGGVISLGIDWPWVFLRSDGKLAMNLFWKSLDSAFFLRKINKRTFSQLQEGVEEMCGVRLSSSHAEYEQVRELLVMPRRERVPAYLVEFRNTLKDKQKFLSSDVLMGVSSQSKDAEADVDEQTALEVGTTVSVAKRTWPGMNKLGGVGRIKKVNEEKLPDGRKRFTYNVTLVMGGHDKNVERKYISVVDIESEEANATEESASSSSRRQKPEPEPDVKDTKGAHASTVSLRLAFSLKRTEDEEKLAALPDASIESPPKRRRFQVQFSTENSTVYCERKHDAESNAQRPEHPAKELLLHKHFEVKLPEVDALTNACFSSALLSVEDRAGDKVDADDTDSEGEADEITKELATLQQQFRTVMESNELAFASLTKKAEEEYAAKEYRQQELQGIRWRNYERMYQELQVAERQFDESDEDSDTEEDGRVPGSGTKAGSEAEAESEGEDISFGGMFVNKLKQEGSEVCALCELSGGDFTGTGTGSVVHPQCAMFTPETFFKDGVVHGIDLVDPERKRLKCSICGGRKGLSKVQCAHRKCVRAYHVACAFVNGLLTRDPYYQAWCPRHLKTSGMGQFVDLPDHLSKKSSEGTATATATATPSTNAASSPGRRDRKSSKQRSRQKKGRARQDTTPAEATTAARTDISSSKSNRKRRRKGSNASVTASGGKSARGTRGSSPRSAIVIEEQEPRCARRLEIDEVSGDDDHEAKAVEAWQQGRDPHHVFLKNDVVEVLARDWTGVNKQGGVARVRAVEVVPTTQGGKDVFYDIIHIVGAFKEKRLPAKFVRSYQSNAE